MSKKENLKKYDFIHSTDARVWASEFLKRFPKGSNDYELLASWFANSIMAGYDYFRNRAIKEVEELRKSLGG